MAMQGITPSIPTPEQGAALVAFVDALCEQLTAIDEAVVALCRLATRYVNDGRPGEPFGASFVLMQANTKVNRAVAAVESMSVLLHRVTGIDYEYEDD